MRAGDPIGLDVYRQVCDARACTVFFRLLLVIPHLIWLALWGIVAFFAVIASWFATLAAGTSPDSLHGFLAAFVRYQTHVYAYLFLIADPFPGFTGQVGSYPVEPLIEGPRPQDRWKVGFRILIAIPALLLNSAYSSLLVVVGVLGWFASLANARMPLGMRNGELLLCATPHRPTGTCRCSPTPTPTAAPSCALPSPPPRALPPRRCLSPPCRDS